MELKHRLMMALIGLIGLAACSMSPSSEPAITQTSIDPPSRVQIVGPKATADEKAACAATGGEVRRAGMRGYETCIRKMPDAGKVCRDGDECAAGRCLAANASTPFDQETTGTCAPTDNVFGCFTAVKDGYPAPTLCVD